MSWVNLDRIKQILALYKAELFLKLLSLFIFYTKTSFHFFFLIDLHHSASEK